MRIRVGELKKLIREATARDVPPELQAIERVLSGMKFKQTSSGWAGTVKASEKNRGVQLKLMKAWDRVKAVLSKQPWQRVSSQRKGFDAQYDIGGNFAAQDSVFVHPSGLNVKLQYGNSFKTGTKTWTVTAWYALGQVHEGLEDEMNTLEVGDIVDVDGQLVFSFNDVV